MVLWSPLMIKKLLVAAALLVPSLGYAGNPSADLSAANTPAAPAPSTPAPSTPASSIPAPAQAAGFTTLALDADFTSAAYSNLSSWMDCGPSYPNSKWQFSMNWWGANGSSCNRAQMTTDGGVQALNIYYLPSDLGSGASNTVLNWPGYWQDGTPGNYLPLELYVETTFRVSSASLNQNPAIQPFDFWNGTSGGNGRPITGQWIETDFFEYSTGGNVNGSGMNTGAGMIAWVNPNCGGQCYDNTAYWNFDPTQYHTIGTLITGDEHSILSKCVFVDGVLAGHCDQLSGAGWATPEPALFTQHNNTLTFWAGGSAKTNRVDLYIKSIKLWECSGYQTQGCPGTVITSWPAP
jgi:hypothetical protein